MGYARSGSLVVRILIGLMLVLPLRHGWAQDEGRIGTVLVVEGVAEVRQQQAITWELLRFRDAMFLDDAVRTAVESKLKVLLNDDSILTIVERSEMQLTGLLVTQQQRQTVFQLALGKIRVLTTQFFGADSSTEIHTPNAVTGVRGSEMVVQHLGNQTTLLCVQGGGSQQDHCFMRDLQDPTREIAVPVGHIAEQVGVGIPATTRLATEAERQTLRGDTLVTAQVGPEVLPTSEQGPLAQGVTSLASAVVVAPEAPQPSVPLPSPVPEGITIDPQTEALTPDTTPTAEETIQAELSRFIIDITR